MNNPASTGSDPRTMTREQAIAYLKSRPDVVVDVVEFEGMTLDILHPEFVQSGDDDATPGQAEEGGR